MKKLAIVIGAIAIIGTPAFAADIAVKAPAPSPAPVYNWTGWYVGGNVGASFGTFKTDFNATPVTAAVTGLGTTCTVAAPCTFTTPGFAGRDEVYPAGFIGGGQLATIGSFLPFSSRGLRPTSKVPTKKSTVLLPRISVATSLLLRLCLAA